MKCQAETKAGKQCKNGAIANSRFCIVHSKSNNVNEQELRHEYDKLLPIARRFSETLQHQIESLISSENLSLGVPIERRVKAYSSLNEKLKRKKSKLHSIVELNDFIGLRVILLFQRDLQGMHALLSQKFKVSSYEDTASRLEESQFGYQSVHYIVSLPVEWLTVPTMSEFQGFRAEVQVRTLAQHIWAAASHKLQYKQESNVPPKLRRSIHRVSAILETVDLEFERLLDMRETYVKDIEKVNEDIGLNVEVVRNTLTETWPKENVHSAEPYSELLDDLTYFGIETVSDLKKIIQEHKDCAMKTERQYVRDHQHEKEEEGISDERKERALRNVFYKHVGLTRIALECSDPEKWAKWGGE